MRSFLRSMPFRLFASRKRRARTPKVEVEEATPEETAQLNKQQGQQTRIRKIAQVKGRVERQQDEAMEKEIYKLVQQGMSDQEIISMLESKMKGQNKQKTKEPNEDIRTKKKISPAQNRFKQMLDDIGVDKVNQAFRKESQAIQKQRALIELMKKTSDQPITATNPKQYMADVAQQAMAKQFLFQQRVLNMVQNQADPQSLKEVDSDDVSSYLISPEMRKQAAEYQQNELRYFSNLIIEKTKHKNPWQQRYYSEEEEEEEKDAPNPLDKLRKEQTNFNLDKKYQTFVEPYEDKTERLLRQYQQVMKPSDEDKKFKEEGLIDLKNTQNSSIFLNQQEALYDRKIERLESPRYRQVNRAKQKHNELLEMGIQAEFDELVQFEKEHLMEEKKYLQEQQIWNYNKQRRDKIKQIKMQNFKLNKDKLADDINYKQPQKVKGFNFKNKNIFGIPDIEQINALNEKYARSQFNGSKLQIDHAHIRTQKNMEEWLNYQLTAVNTAHRILHKIHIQQITFNDSLTVINVHWIIRPRLPGNFSKSIKSKTEENAEKEEIDRIQTILEEASVALATKMCQQLGLRFGPSIRFAHYKQSAQTEVMHGELLSNMPYIIREKIKEDYEKGKLPKKVKIKEFETMLTDIQEQYRNKVEEMKADESEEEVDQPRRQRKHKKEPSEKRKKAVQRFWDQL